MSEDTKKEAKDLPKNLQSIVDEIEKLSIMEVADLVSALEDKFGVSAAAPMMMAGAMPGAAAEGAKKEDAEKAKAALEEAGATVELK